MVYSLDAISLSFHCQPFCQSLPFGEFNPFTFKVVANEKEDFPGGSVSKDLPAMQETALGRSLGEGMATHSSILAWEIPWTEEPGGLLSMELEESDMT